MTAQPQHIRYRLVGKVVLRHIGSDPLLVPVSGVAAHRNSVYPLNETAAFIWERLSSGTCVVETAAALAAEFDVDHVQAADDCQRLAELMIREGLLEACGA